MTIFLTLAGASKPLRRCARSARQLLMLCALAAPLVAAQAQDARNLSLAEAQLLALQAHPGVGEAAARARIAGFDLLRARARHLPRADLQNSSPVGGSSSTSARSASLSVNLWAGGAIEAQAEQQNAVFDAQRERLAGSCADTAAAVADAYVRRLRAQALTIQAARHLEHYGRLQAMVEEIARVDRGRRSDVDQVTTRHEMVRLAYWDAQNLGRLARNQLQRVVGQPVDVTAENLDAWLAPAVAADGAAVLEQAQRVSPLLAAARHELLAAERAVAAAKGSRWPQINLVAEQARDRSLNGRSSDNRVFLQTQWSLFNGGQDMHAEQAALQGVLAARSRVEDSQRTLALDVAQAWEGRQLATQRLGNVPAQAQAALAVLQANTELFRLGRRTVLDLLSAQNDVHQVQVSRIEAEHEAWAQSLRLASLGGSLLPRLNLPATHSCGTQGVPTPSLRQALGL